MPPIGTRRVLARKKNTDKKNQGPSKSFNQMVKDLRKEKQSKK